MEAILITVLFIVAVVVDAIGDGYKYLKHTDPTKMKHPKWQKWFSWQSENILLFLGFIIYPIILLYYKDTIPRVLVYSLIGYPLMRLSLFNIIWNKAARKDQWWFYGTQKLTDRILRWFIENSWIAKKIKPREPMMIGAIMIFSFLFSLVATGVWQFIEK